jgi:hypothetical protein
MKGVDENIAPRGSPEWRTKISQALQANWDFKKVNLGQLYVEYRQDEEKKPTKELSTFSDNIETTQTPQTKIAPTTRNEVTESKERILGSFSSGVPQDPRHDTGSYHIFVTNRRITGMKIYAGASPPKTPKELDNPQGRLDFSIARESILSVTMRNAGKNRNLFAIRLRCGNSLKILLKHSTFQELRKEKELLLEEFR